MRSREKQSLVSSVVSQPHSLHIAAGDVGNQGSRGKAEIFFIIFCPWNIVVSDSHSGAGGDGL